MEYENVFHKLPLYVRFRLTFLTFAIWFMVWDILRLVLVTATEVVIVKVIIPTFSVTVEDVVSFLDKVPAYLVIVVLAAYFAFRLVAHLIRSVIIPRMLLRPVRSWEE